MVGARIVQVTGLPPGLDEITLGMPEGQHLCSSRGCASAGRLAEVIVTFGQLADPGSGRYGRDVLWSECWGLSYPMCGRCWDSTRQVAARFRPRLTIRDTTRPSEQPVRPGHVHAGTLPTTHSEPR